jgi:hypothetical protein
MTRRGEFRHAFVSINRFCQSLCPYLAVLVLVGAVANAEQPKNNARARDAAFERLTSLVGQWTGIEFGEEATVTYTLIANGTTLVEETRSSNPAETMMTMFSVRGDRLDATHYCSFRNVPDMETGPITGRENNVYKFSLVRLTGLLSSEKDAHNTGVEFVLEDKDHMTQRWTYSYKGKTGVNVFHLTRKHT